MIAHLEAAGQMPNFNLSGVQIFVLQILGTGVTCVLATQLFIHWVQAGWGRMITTLAGGLIVFWFVWFPTSAIDAVKSVVSTVTGGTA